MKLTIANQWKIIIDISIQNGENQVCISFIENFPMEDHMI